MGKFRARLAKEPLDREMHEHLADAERALARAEDVCIRASRSLRGPSAKYGGQFAGRALANLRALRQAKVVLGRIGCAVPNRDFSDMDMLSEDALAERARIQRQLEQEARRAEAHRAIAEGEV